MDCVFCEIIKGNIPCHKIFENDFTMAFLDIGAEGYGHTLVVPKTHCVNIFDCDSKMLNEVMKTIKIISQHFIDDCGFDGVNILNANNVSAQQSVFHFHVHIIPRKTGDGMNAFPKLPKYKNELKDVCQKLKITENI